MPQTSSLSPDTKYRLLLDISQQLSRTLELEAMLSDMLEAVRSAVPYDAAGVFVLNHTVPRRKDEVAGDPVTCCGIGRTIAGMAMRGFPEAARPDDPMFQEGKGIIGYVIHTGERVLEADVRRNPHYIAGRPTTQSEVAVPIVVGGQVIGALDLESDRPDAFSHADLELLDFFATVAALSIEKAVLHGELLEKHRLDQQLSTAHAVQASLLPSAPPALPGYDIAGINVPTWSIGGDYFDYVPLADGRLGLVVADVSGKGVPAALIMATLRGALRTRLLGGGDLAQTVLDVDRCLLESTDAGRFVTAVYGTLDPTTGHLTYANCGHNPPLLIRAGGGREFLFRGRRALGMIEQEPVEPATVSLAAGDVLALYTDGVVELGDPGLQEFGVDRLEAVLREVSQRPAGEMIQAVVEATRQHARRDRYEDDFTLVVVKRRHPGQDVSSP